MSLNLNKKIILSISSFIFILVLIEILLQFSAYLYNSYYAQVPQKLNKDNKEIIKILTLGESTTFLYGKDSYPSVLQMKLNSTQGHKNYLVINAGVPGTDTSMILRNLDKNIVKYTPQIVILMMGVNDFWKLDTPIIHNESWLLGRSKILKLLNLGYVNLTNYTKKGFEFFNFPWIKNKSLSKKYSADRNTEINYIGKEDPNFNATFIEARTHAREGNLKKAFNLYRKRSPHFNDEHRIVFDLWSIYENSNKEVNEFYFMLTEEAILKKPDAFWHYAFIANYLPENKNNVEKIIKYARTALINGSKSSYLFIRISQSYELIGEHKKSLLALEKGVIFSLENKIHEYFSWLFKWGKRRNSDFKFIKKYLKEIKYSFPELSFIQNTYWDSKEDKLKINISTSDEIYLNPQTIKNYQFIVAKLKHNKIKVIAMQYPRLSISPILKMLKRDDEIIFVENKDNFKQALKTHQYSDLFTDDFAVKFGHFTRTGSELISENIISELKKYKLLE